MPAVGTKSYLLLGTSKNHGIVQSNPQMTINIQIVSFFFKYSCKVNKMSICIKCWVWLQEENLAGIFQGLWSLLRDIFSVCVWVCVQVCVVVYPQKSEDTVYVSSYPPLCWRQGIMSIATYLGPGIWCASQDSFFLPLMSSWVF